MSAPPSDILVLVDKTIRDLRNKVYRKLVTDVPQDVIQRDPAFILGVMYPLYVMYVIDFSDLSVKYPKWLEDTMFVTLYDTEIENSIKYHVTESPQYIKDLKQQGLYSLFEAGLQKVRNDYIIPTEQNTALTLGYREYLFKQYLLDSAEMVNADPLPYLWIARTMFLTLRDPSYEKMQKEKPKRAYATLQEYAFGKNDLIQYMETLDFVVAEYDENVNATVIAYVTLQPNIFMVGVNLKPLRDIDAWFKVVRRNTGEIVRIGQDPKIYLQDSLCVYLKSEYPSSTQEDDLYENLFDDKLYEDDFNLVPTSQEEEDDSLVNESQDSVEEEPDAYSNIYGLGAGFGANRYGFGANRYGFGAKRRRKNFNFEYNPVAPEEAGGVGIQNAGNNNCFFNSLLQSLFCTFGVESLLEYWNSLKITSVEEEQRLSRLTEKKREEERKQREKEEQRKSLLTAILSAYDTSTKGPRTPIKAAQQVNDLRKSLGLPCGSQEDPSDALMLLLNSKTDFLPRDLITFKFISTTQTADCDDDIENSVKTEDMAILTIESKYLQESLQETLDFMVKQMKILEPLESLWEHDENKPRVQGYRSYQFEDLPQFIIVSLKIFTYDQTSRRFAKINTKVEVDYDQTYTIQGESYTPRAVILHEGRSLRSGHYIARCKFRDQWFYFNDQTVIDTYNGTGSPYMIFLEKDDTVYSSDTSIPLAQLSMLKF